MRLRLNLATRPYRDVRRFAQTWGTGTAVFALLTIVLCWYTAHSWLQTRSARAQLSQVRTEIEKLDRQREAGIVLLNQPQNHDVTTQAAFLNSLIARRSFSWTQLFMELEQIMPAQLHVTSIAPSLNKNNEIEIHMLVGGNSREQAVELVRRLEDSHAFRRPTLRSETFLQNAQTAPGGDRVQFDISLVYVPPPAPEKAEEIKTPHEPPANDEKSANRASSDKSGETTAARSPGSTRTAVITNKGGQGMAR